MHLEETKPDPPLHFPDWPAALAATVWPPAHQAAVGATVPWYLSFCQRSRLAVDQQSARDFIAQVEQAKRPSPARLERWKEAIRWFWRAARKAHLAKAVTRHTLPPQFRHPLAGGRHGHSHGAGSVGAQKCGHPTDLHAREGQTGARSEKPAGHLNAECRQRNGAEVGKGMEAKE